MQQCLIYTFNHRYSAAIFKEHIPKERVRRIVNTTRTLVVPGAPATTISAPGAWLRVRPTFATTRSSQLPVQAPSTSPALLVNSFSDVEWDNRHPLKTTLKPFTSHPYLTIRACVTMRTEHLALPHADSSTDVRHDPLANENTIAQMISTYTELVVSPIVHHSCFRQID
jgi:hypothetical protein